MASLLCSTFPSYSFLYSRAYKAWGGGGWLKAQHSENEDHGIRSHHFMGNRWGNIGNSVRLYFSGLQNHCRWWLHPEQLERPAGFPSSDKTRPYSPVPTLQGPCGLSPKHLLISWLQSPSVVILEPRKIKSDTVSNVSPSISHEVMGPDAMILCFLNVEL